MHIPFIRSNQSNFFNNYRTAASVGNLGLFFPFSRSLYTSLLPGSMCTKRLNAP